MGTRVLLPCALSPLAGGAGGEARCGNQRAGNKVTALPGPSARTPGPAPADPRPQHGDHGARLGGQQVAPCRGCGTPVLPSAPAGPDCSLGLCDRSILFLPALDLRGLSASPQRGPAGDTRGWEVMPPPAASASSPAAAPALGAPALQGSPSSPTPGEADDFGSAVAPRLGCHPWGSCSKCGSRQGCPGDGGSAVAPSRRAGVVRAPTPCAPSLAPPGTGAAPVPLAQAAARARWPWHSQRRPWPAEDAEWPRLRRGLGSSISITPPWAGSAPRSQARPLRGARQGRGTRAEPNPAPARLEMFQGSAVIGQGRSWGGCRSITSTPGLNAQIAYSPGGHSVLANTSVPGQKSTPSWDKTPSIPG